MPKRAKSPPIIQITPQGTFRVQFSRDGQKFDRTFKLRNDAQKFIDTFAADTLTLEAFVETSYKRSPEWRALKPTSKAAYTSRLRKICSLAGHLPLKAFSKEVIDGYLADREAENTRLGRPPAPDTIRQELVVLGKVLKVAVGYGKVPGNPVSLVAKPRQNRRVVRVSPEQRNNFLLLAQGRVTYRRTFRGKDLGNVPANERAQEAGRFLFVLSDLGGRASELAKLPADNVDFPNECIHLPDTKKNEPQRRWFGVTAAKLFQLQLNYIADHPKNPNGLLFPSNQGTAHDYQYSVAIVRALGLVDQEFHSHACRREFVSNARELGYKDPDIAKDLGISLATLARYDVSTGKTPEERGRRQQFNKLRTLQLREAMGDARAQVELGNALAVAEAHGEGASEIAAMDAEFSVAVVPQVSAAESVKRAVSRGELSSDELLQLLLEAKAREAKK